MTPAALTELTSASKDNAANGYNGNNLYVAGLPSTNTNEGFPQINGSQGGLDRSPKSKKYSSTHTVENHHNHTEGSP